MTGRLTELEAIARAASQQWYMPDAFYADFDLADAKHFAAFSPDVARKLLAVARLADECLRAQSAEASAQMTATTAEENYTDARPDLDALSKAMQVASRAEKALRAALQSLGEPT